MRLMKDRLAVFFFPGLRVVFAAREGWGSGGEGWYE